MTFSKNNNFNTTMQPGGFAKFMRTCVIWQLVRLGVLSIKMFWVVIVIGH
jgi:hypothetical protein